MNQQVGHMSKPTFYIMYLVMKKEIKLITFTKSSVEHHSTCQSLILYTLSPQKPQKNKRKEIFMYETEKILI